MRRTRCRARPGDRGAEGVSALLRDEETDWTDERFSSCTNAKKGKAQKNSTVHDLPLSCTPTHSPQSCACALTAWSKARRPSCPSPVVEMPADALSSPLALWLYTLSRRPCQGRAAQTPHALLQQVGRAEDERARCAERGGGERFPTLAIACVGAGPGPVSGRPCAAGCVGARAARGGARGGAPAPQEAIKSNLGMPLLPALKDSAACFRRSFCSSMSAAVISTGGGSSR